MSGIRALQERLRDLGFDPGPLDSVWGQSTGRAMMRALDRIDPAWPTPKTTIADVQARLRSLGFDAGQSDNRWGPRTAAAVSAALDRLPTRAARATRIVPAAWMPAASMQRIIAHWTGGNHTPNGLDRAHYHVLIQGDGTLVRGTPSILANQNPVKTGYAAHTWNCNGGSIGISACCMADAAESPFNPGSAPMTRAQWDVLALAVADLAEAYGIPITPRSVLSHAEVQDTLGITQRRKWDFTRLAFDPTVVGATACGDLLRAAASAALLPHPLERTA